MKSYDVKFWAIRPGKAETTASDGSAPYGCPCSAAHFRSGEGK